MIHIEKNQEVFGAPNLRVSSPTGDYDDTDLIEFYDISKNQTPPGAFQAQCVKYGNLVYKFSDAKELGEEILRIDPESTHEAASFVRMSNELLARMNKGTLDVDTLNEITDDAKIKVEAENDPAGITPNATVPPTATSTTPIAPAIPTSNNSSTTPTINPIVPTKTPTSTLSTFIKEDTDIVTEEIPVGKIIDDSLSKIEF